MVLLAAAFAVLDVLVSSRMGRPLGPAKPIPEMAGKRAEPIAVLSKGLRESLGIARNALRTGDRSRAARALDAAMRASDVGKHAGGPAIAAKFDDANRRIKEARVALQDGRSGQAEQLAGAALAIVATTNAFGAEAPLQSIIAGTYKGAKVLNARGVRLGEIRSLRMGLFGFLDFGGQELRVPLDRVLLGEAKKIGSTFVVLSMLATAPDDVRNQPVAEIRGR